MMNLRRTDMGLLIALDALLKEGSVTRAARKLGLSQPAVSAQLAKLRLLFNDALLVGNAHGMTATPRGQELKEPLGELLSDLEELVTRQAEFNPLTQERTFKIIATDYIHATITRPLITALPELAPSVKIAALPFSKKDLREQLANGAADICITAEKLTPSDFPARKLMHERFVLIMSKSHPSAQKRMTLDLFCELDHILASPIGGGFRGVIDVELDALGRTRKIVGSLNSFLLVPDIVKTSRFIAVVPEQLALVCSDGLVIKKLPFEVAGFDIYQSWHPRLKSDKSHIWLRETISAQVRSQVE